MLIRRASALAAVTLWSLALPLILRAQVVRGRVREESTGTPVGGAVVTLLDREARRLSSALTSDEGQFAVAAPTPGDYMLEVKRIGVRRVTTPVFGLAAGATHERDVTVATVPMVQPEVRVSGRSLCGRRLEDGPALAALWEDLRAALTAARLTQEQRLLHVRTATYFRRLDARGERVLKETRQEQQGVTVTPFVSVSPEKLSRHGYVDSLSADGVIYYGPDATVLTSEEFVRDHCFSLVRGEGEERQWVGMAFEPVPRRRIPDVEGVLWVDLASRELRRVDFHYTSHRRLSGREGLGGRVEFARLPQGSWIVSRWWIRMPEIAMASGAVLPNQPRSQEPRIRFIQEDGGEVMTVSSQGKTLRLSGAATAGVPPSRADSLSAVVLERPADAAPVSRGTLCQKEGSADSVAAVSGTVRDQAGAPVAAAQLSLRWETFAEPTSGTIVATPVVLETESAADGTFVFCAPKADHPLELRASSGATARATVRLRAEPGAITVRDVVLPMRRPTRQ